MRAIGDDGHNVQIRYHATHQSRELSSLPGNLEAFEIRLSHVEGRESAGMAVLELVLDSAAGLSMCDPGPSPETTAVWGWLSAFIQSEFGVELPPEQAMWMGNKGFHAACIPARMSWTVRSTGATSWSTARQEGQLVYLQLTIPSPVQQMLSGQDYPLLSLLRDRLSSWGFQQGGDKQPWSVVELMLLFEQTGEIRTRVVVSSSEGFRIVQLKDHDSVNSQVDIEAFVSSVDGASRRIFHSAAGSSGWHNHTEKVESGARIWLQDWDLHGKGSHRELHASIQATGIDGGCPHAEAVLALSVPSTAYLDRYELAEHARFGGATAEFLSDVDLEAAARSSPPHISILRQLLPQQDDLGATSLKLKIPIHLRYQAPSLSGFASVVLPPPRLFLHCSNHSIAESLLSMAFPSEEKRSRLKPSYGHSAGVISQVTTMPVGNPAHRLFITIGTMTVTLGGAALIISSLWKAK